MGGDVNTNQKMEPSTSKHADTSRIKIKEEPIEDPFETSSKQSRKRSKVEKKTWGEKNLLVDGQEVMKQSSWLRSIKELKKQQTVNQQTTKNKDKGKEEVVDVEQESEMNERLEKQKQAKTKKIKKKGKEKVVDVEDESETNERVQKQSFNRVLKGRATVRPLFEAMRGLTPQRKRVVREMGFGNLINFPIVEIPTKLAFYVVDILNTRKMMLECPMGDIVITLKIVKEVIGLPMGRRNWMNILTLIANTLGSCENNSCLKFTVLRNVFEGDDVVTFDEILDDVGEKEENEEKEELYELIEESIKSILLDKAEIEEKINENLIKFQNDERLIQLRDKMKVIFKEPNIPEYHSSSSTKSNDDDDDNLQVGDDNEKSYGTQTDSVEEDHVQIVTETQQEERNNLQYNDEENDGKKNEEEIIRKGREFSAEIRKNAQQQERERKRKGKREKDQIGSSSQESPVFGIDNSLQGSQLTFDLGESPTYEKMEILIKNKKKMGLKSKYVNKTVDPAVELTEDEKLLGRSIFKTQEEEEEEVFNDDEGLILFRMNIQSLAPGLEIDTSVIDVYVSILNYEEKFKMMNMKRHFFYTSMMVPGILEDKTTEIDKKIDAQYDRFHEMLLIQMENDVEKMQMEDVELVY
ncbi:hypothetical protein Tco_0370295 [Tanacetum coccineum]